MAKLSVYYEEHFETNSLVPIWMVVYFGKNKIQWEKNQFYLPLSAPFKRKRREDFGEEVMSFSVTIGDLKRDPDRPDGFLVDIKTMLQRIYQMQTEHFFNHHEIDQFIIQIADIEEIMMMNVEPYFVWE